jgi:hypothetical protein
MRFKQFMTEYAAASPEARAGVNELRALVNSASSLPADNPARLTVEKLLNTIMMKGAGQLAETDAPQGSRLSIVEAAIAAFLKLSPEEQAKAREAIAAGQNAVEVAKTVVKNPEVSQSFQALETKVKLDVQGNIVKMDKELETLAQDIAESLHLNIKWARNLIGMFNVNISREDRNAFIAACKAGTALDMTRMFEDKEGRLEDYITNNPPSIKQVFQSVKGTLLDISLSSGQGAATGPFEAMLAIMGGAKKAEKGDLLINDRKYEVKSSSISVGAKGNNNSNAWLDATGEVAPSAVRQLFRTILEESAPDALKNNKADFDKADFRPNGIQSLANLLNATTNPNAIMYKLHSTLLPDTAKIETPQYSFKASVKRLVTAIQNQDTPAIAKEQGIMAMLQYAAGPYQSGFILYNSSFQVFKIIDTVEDIAALAADPDSQGVHFESKGMTMGKSRKSSPGIYYGPTANSPEGKQYIVQTRQSPDYIKKYKAGLAVNKKEQTEHGMAAPEKPARVKVEKPEQSEAEKKADYHIKRYGNLIKKVAKETYSDQPDVLRAVITKIDQDYSAGKIHKSPSAWFKRLSKQFPELSL